MYVHVYLIRINDTFLSTRLSELVCTMAVTRQRHVKYTLILSCLQSAHADQSMHPIVPSTALCNSYTMGCPPVRGDNPRALASGLSNVQVDKHVITILYHLHQ